MTKAKETKNQRDQRIRETENGRTLRTRVVPKKKVSKRIETEFWEIELEEEE